MLTLCDEAVIRAENEAALLARICELAVERGGYAMALVAYAQEDAHASLMPVAHAGRYAGEYAANIRLSWSDQSPDGAGPTGQTIRTGIPAVAVELARSAGHSPCLAEALRLGMHGVITLPLRGKSRIFGVLALYSGAPISVGATEMQLLQKLASDLAFGIGAHAGRCRRLIDSSGRCIGLLAVLFRTLARESAIDASAMQIFASRAAAELEREEYVERIRQLAFYDPLTQLPNRRLLLDRLRQALAAVGRSRKCGALLFIDLDKFKALNDTLGHDKGDLLLQQVAGRLVSCVRADDTVARLGGDEFVILLEGLSGDPKQAAGQAGQMGEKILTLFAEPFRLDCHEHRCTPSIGATLFGSRPVTVEEVLKQADLAMYETKAAGRNGIRFSDRA